MLVLGLDDGERIAVFGPGRHDQRPVHHGGAMGVVLETFHAKTIGICTSTRSPLCQTRSITA